MVALEPLHDTTKGKDIYEAVIMVLNDTGGAKKLSAIVTDGTKYMCNSETGLVGLLRKDKINCPPLHCIIHQAALTENVWTWRK